MNRRKIHQIKIISTCNKFALLVPGSQDTLMLILELNISNIFLCQYYL